MKTKFIIVLSLLAFTAFVLSAFVNSTSLAGSFFHGNEDPNGGLAGSFFHGNGDGDG